MREIRMLALAGFRSETNVISFFLPDAVSNTKLFRSFWVERQSQSHYFSESEIRQIQVPEARKGQKSEDALKSPFTIVIDNIV